MSEKERAERKKYAYGAEKKRKGQNSVNITGWVPEK